VLGLPGRDAGRGPPGTMAPYRAPRSIRSSRTYAVRATFRAPLDFVFQWCTDYSPRDPVLHHGDYERKIVERRPHRVVFEDLYPLVHGWSWSRGTSRLQPPDRWHAEERGNHRDWSIDYRLYALSPDRTELRLRGRRTPTAIGPPNPPKAALEAEISGMWRQFGRALEAEYRRRKGGRRRPRRSLDVGGHARDV
jgi:hypothetical protein